MTTKMAADCERAHHGVTKADNQIVKNGLIFIEQVQHHLIDNFLQHNQAKNNSYFLHLCMF